MKRTSLILADDCMKQLKRIASEDNVAVSELVNGILKRAIAERLRKRKKKLPITIQTFSMGKERVNLADRDQLEQRMSDDG